MKKLIGFTAVLVFLSMVSHAQKFQEALLFGKKENRFIALISLGVPNDTLTVADSARKNPHIAIKGNTPYIWDTTTKRWNAWPGGGGGGGSVLQVDGGTGFEPISITTTGVLNIDTSFMETKGAAKKTSDSLSAIAALKVKYTDTSSMLNPYVRKVDTSGKWVADLYKKPGTDSVFQNKGGVLTFKFRTDSVSGGSPNTSVGSGYKIAINGTNNVKSLTAGTNILIDSATSNQVNIKADTTTANTGLATKGYVDRALAIPDTAKVLWPLYSKLGSAGQRDTLAIKEFTGSDSGYMTPSKWATVLKYADSSGMLSPYLRKIDTTNRTIRLFPGTNITITGTFPNYTISASGGGGSYTASQSITLSGSNFTLTNDNATPGNNYAYGTNSSGTKGFNKMAVIDTAGISDGSFTYYDNASGTWKMLAPVANKNLRWNGTAWVYKDTTAVGGGGSPNTSVGSGFRVAINGTNNIKSLTAGINILIDSATSNQVNFSVDTTTGSTKVATQGDIDRGIAAVGLKQVTAINDSAINRIITNDTLKGADVVIHQKNIVGDATASGKAMTVYGTSIADINPPTNVTVAQNYVTGVSQGLGFNLIDRAKAGSTTMQYSAGDSSVENKIYTIPTKTSAHGLLLLDAPGLNDFYVPFGHAFDTVALKAMLNKWLDTAHTARGWSYDSIVFVSAPYTTSTQYPHAHDANRAARTVCESRGVMFVDMETFMQARSGYFSPGDTIHSNSVGHQFYTANILKSLPNFKKVGFLNVHGGSQIEDSLYVKNLLRIGDFTPTYLPSSYKAIIGGDLDVFGIIRNGNQTSDLHSGKVQIETSIGVPAFSTKDGSGTADLYVPYLQFNNSGSVIKYGYSNIDINAVSGYFTIVGGSGLKVAEFGPSTGVILNGSNYTAGSLQTKGSGSSYLIFTDPRAGIDRVGIRDSVPQQTFSVRGSGFFLDSLIAAGKFKLSGIPQAAGSKLLHWDPSTNMVSWADSTAAGGSGEVNTASNLGVTTYGLWKQKVGVDLQFKSLTSTAPIVLTSNTNDVQIGLDTAAGKWRSENYYNTKFLSAIDTGNISSFAAKVRSLHTVSSPVVYNSATGLISLDTATGKWRSENYYNTKFISAIAGTTNRITVTGTTAPVIDISASYVGQSSITTLGTVTSGGLGTGATIGGITPAFGSDATGDMYYRNSGGVWVRLPIGTSKQVLHGGTIPVWLDTTATGGASYTFAKSLVNNSGTVTLVGDSNTLNGPPYVYGSQAGIRTFYKAITTNLTSPATGDVITYRALDTTLVNTTKPVFLLYNNYRADTVITTDATQTTIATIATAGSAFYSKGTLEITLDASSTTAGISGSRIYRFVNNGGTMTITDQTDIAADDLATLTTASWTVVVSGNNLVVKVTGQASQALTWIALSKIHWSQTAL